MLRSFEAASTMCELSNWSITNLQLQKLLYISHLISLGAYNRKLVNENFEAWNLGPVLPSVYQRLRIFGAKPVRNILLTGSASKDSEDFSILEDVYNKLGKVEGYVLVGLTHKPKGGWAKNFEPRFKSIIPDKDIINEYKAYYEKK